MTRKKPFYTGININGFTWSGWWDKFHHFVKRETGGYLEVRCTDQDIDDGNLAQMIEYGLTK